MNDKQHAQLDFRMRPEVWAAVQKELLDSLSGGDAARRAAMAGELAQRDLIAEFAQAARPHGLSEHNVADIMAMFWLTAWTLVNDEAMPERAAVAGVRDQALRLLRRNPQMREERKRALAGGGMIVETVLALDSLRLAQASGDAGMRAALAETAYQNMLKKGLDVRSHRPAAEGFRPVAEPAALVA